MDLKPWVVPEAVETGTINIAGAALTVLKSIKFRDVKYDFYVTPFWLDAASKSCGRIFVLVEVMIVKNRLSGWSMSCASRPSGSTCLKIKIPEAQEHIRKIRICLGDQQANAVGISKVAKKKLVAQDVPELAMAG